MTVAPDDLLAFRLQLMGETGLTDGNAIGIVGDPRHAATGGYHEGGDTLMSIGKYHPTITSAHPLKDEDYSVRTARDRAGISNYASALDLGLFWGRGGKAAAVRYNNLLVQQLRAGDKALAPIRAINYTDNGTAKWRIDRESGFSRQSSTDTVDTHTHHEYYRDTVGARAGCFARQLEIAQAAILNQPLRAGEVRTDKMQMVARDGNGNYFVTDLVQSRAVPKGKQGDVLYLARQMGFAHNAGGNSPEWTDEGWTRLGWTPEVYGPLAGSAVDVQALGTIIANQLNAAGHEIDAQVIVDALESPDGQRALVQAANTAEDS